MRKILLLMIFSAIGLTGLLAQNVGINETGVAPNSNAMLDIDANSNHDKGLLIPRLTTSERTGISGLGAGDEGLTVYDTNTNSYWLWDGTQWNEFGMGKAWLLGGNSGTTAGTNYIGTSDNVSLSFKTNGTERVRVLNTGELGVGTTSPTSTLHVNGDARVDGDFYNQQVAYDTDFSSTWTSSTNNTWEDTDLSITITTHGSGANGSDIFVACNGSFEAYADNFGVRIVRDGSTIITGGFQDAYTISGGDDQWAFSFEGVDSPSAGSHTYTVQIYVSDSSTSNDMVDATMSAMEIKK